MPKSTVLKPLFKQKEVLTVQDLYHYYVGTEVFKLLKLRTPISLVSCFNLSKRKDTLLILSELSCHFLFSASRVWNLIRNKLGIFDFSTKISVLKKSLRTQIFTNQNKGDIILNGLMKIFPSKILKIFQLNKLLILLNLWHPQIPLYTQHKHVFSV